MASCMDRVKVPLGIIVSATRHHKARNKRASWPPALLGMTTSCNVRGVLRPVAVTSPKSGGKYFLMDLRKAEEEDMFGLVHEKVQDVVLLLSAMVFGGLLCTINTLSTTGEIILWECWGRFFPFRRRWAKPN